MPFTVNPDIMAVIMQMMPNGPPPPPKDIAERRAHAAQFAAGVHAIHADAPATPDVEIKTITVPATNGGPPITCYWIYHTKAEKGPAVLHAHMGGMISLSSADFHFMCKQHVQSTGVPMLSVEYRLAPENPHPGIITECYTALKWLAGPDGAALGVDPTRIAVMGESAGGCISAGLCHLALQNPDGPQIKLQILIYPMLDDRNLTPDPAFEGAPLVWSYADNEVAWQMFTGKTLAERNAGEVDLTAMPARVTDAKGLPPAYIETGALDIFKDEAVDYAKKLWAAGVDTELHVYQGMIHAFECLTPKSPVSQAAVAGRNRAIKSI